MPDEEEAARCAARQTQVAAALARVLPRSSILTRREETAPFECDGLTAFRVTPMVVALPETETELACALRVCHDLGVPVVARGAGTGLSGGALPHRAGVTLSLAKFNAIIKIDPRSATAVVQCGVRNLAISEAAAPYGLYYAPDPSSQIACTIGGNVAENSGGVHCLKYGMTLHNVLRVPATRRRASRWNSARRPLTRAGLDLLAIVIGSEGMLAVIDRGHREARAEAQLARCIMASFPTIESAGRRGGERDRRAASSRRGSNSWTGA